MNSPSFPQSRVVPIPLYQFPSAASHWNHTVPVIRYRTLFRLSSRRVFVSEYLTGLFMLLSFFPMHFKGRPT